MSRNATPTHFAFSDESHHNVGRFRSIALVTANAEKTSLARRKMETILKSSEVKEFKWQKLKTKKTFFCAEKIVDLVASLANRLSFRVDVLLWDTEDKRHRLQGRDDVANLQTMYFHLIRVVLRNRWPQNCLWQICPDENTAIDWDSLRHYLDMKARRFERPHEILGSQVQGWQLVQDFHIAAMTEVRSHEEPLVQIADLFAGLSIFSHAEFDTYEQWTTENLNMNDFIGFDGVFADTPSNAGKTRSSILSQFNHECKRRKLRVSLKTKRGLITMNKRYPLSFWLWEPQNEFDRAPVRGER